MACKYPKEVKKAYICEENDPDKDLYLEKLGVKKEDAKTENGKVYYQPA